VTALVDVNLAPGAGRGARPVGDNGAGKSTLIKIICGFQPPSGGRILLNGRRCTSPPVTQARSLGIDVVYQDLR